MLTQEEINSIYDGGESEVFVIDNPASPATDATLSVIAKRMDQFRRSKWLNPNQVEIGDFDVVSAYSNDPKNAIDLNYYFYIFRHKRTGRATVVQNSAAYGWMVPFNVVKDLSDLAD